MTFSPAEHVKEAIRVSGTVQGVGFRAFVQKKALQHSLFGYVENHPDGTVYLEVSGPSEALESFVRALWTGPSPVAKVENVERSRFVGKVSAHDSSFEIRRA